MIYHLRNSTIGSFKLFIISGLLLSLSSLAKFVDIEKIDNPRLQSFVSKNPFYERVQIVGFGESLGDTQQNMASSCLLDTNDKCVYQTLVMLSKNTITLVLDRQCLPTEKGSWIPEVITVNEQRINASYGCFKDSNAWSDYRKLYFLETVEGKNFILEQFHKNELVFIDLGTGVPIPISTKNFKEGWDLLNAPAL